MTAQTKAEIREMIAALRPPADAMRRAVKLGYLSFDDETGWVEGNLVIPAAPANPDQLSLD